MPARSMERSGAAQARAAKDRRVNHSPAWFSASLAHCRDALAEADRQHTDDELRAARAALAERGGEVQRELFEGE